MNNENPYLANGKQELRKYLTLQHTFFYSQVKWLDKARPFVLNATIEKRGFKQKNGIVSLMVMDVRYQQRAKRRWLFC
ncbi:MULTISPECIES: hypothetical protein [Sphingobacterium]|uniref:hypothetical protein n=1 Tax=Sphingobacterium TaxID=28453 RepID=UPI0013D97A32|nr:MULTISPECIES: hypothetical protein [unclassified Sphingobacterium]